MTLTEKEKQLTPENCLGYHQFDYQRKAVQVHICNQCYNPEKGYDMEYFWKKCEIKKK